MSVCTVYKHACAVKSSRKAWAAASGYTFGYTSSEYTLLAGALTFYPFTCE